MDSDVAWVVGDRGTILKTTDGGVTWQSLPWGTGERFWGVAAVNAETAWVVGDLPLILKTADGGSTWSASSYGTTDWLQDVSALDDRTVWAVGANGTIVKTTDGGGTWKSQMSGTTKRLQAVAVLDAESVWAAGNAGVISRTTPGVDTSLNSLPSPTPTPTSLPGPILEDVVFTFSGTGLQSTPPFEITSSPWKLRYQTNYSGDFGLILRDISSVLLINEKDLQGGDSDETLVFGRTGTLFFTPVNVPPGGQWTVWVIEDPD